MIFKEKILSGRSTYLRKNNSEKLILTINSKSLDNIFLINGNSFKTEEIKDSDLKIKSYDYYMIFNNGKESIDISYYLDISNHEIVYDPYVYENSEKILYTEDQFIKNYDIPKGYIDILSKWYSFKFTYPDYNLIFVRPEFGLSIQIHKNRNEFWEILEGNPIIINGNKVYYYVESGSKFQNKINMFHTVINPNKEAGKFVLIKERWNGEFDENDIIRVFNPNQYF
ncbi:MAG: hypothetical protein ACFFA3_02965 [Promethearchaeota archaeon]